MSAVTSAGSNYLKVFACIEGALLFLMLPKPHWGASIVSSWFYEIDEMKSWVTVSEPGHVKLHTRNGMEMKRDGQKRKRSENMNVRERERKGDKTDRERMEG